MYFVQTYCDGARDRCAAPVYVPMGPRSCGAPVVQHLEEDVVTSRWDGTKTRERRWSVALLALVGLAVLAGPAGAQAVDDVAQLNDGPHVYWESKTDAIVFYLCDGELALQRYRTSSAITFKGMCADSLVTHEIAARSPTIQPFEFTNVPKIFAVSDIHGDYNELVRLFQAAGVIDDNLGWSWGTGHLVIVGDIFDRGSSVTECLWLIYRLEREAEAAGGRVHYLLGNHEMMALRGDERYVNPKYLSGIVRYTTIKYQDLFGPETELGRWLRTKNLGVKLNDVLFVHGGLGPAAVERGLDLKSMNRTGRKLIDLSSSELFFSDEPFFVNGSEGPLWYRGYHYGMGDRYQPITSDELDQVLAYYGASAVVVGHTERDQVERLFNGRVYGVDVPVQELGKFEGLLWENGTFSKVGEDGTVGPIPDAVTTDPAGM